MRWRRSGRLLPSPRHAARFVALLPLAAAHASSPDGALGGLYGDSAAAGLVAVGGAPWPTHFTMVHRTAIQSTHQHNSQETCNRKLDWRTMLFWGN